MPRARSYGPKEASKGHPRKQARKRERGASTWVALASTCSEDNDNNPVRLRRPVLHRGREMHEVAVLKVHAIPDASQIAAVLGLCSDISGMHVIAYDVLLVRPPACDNLPRFSLISMGRSAANSVHPHLLPPPGNFTPLLLGVTSPCFCRL